MKWDEERPFLCRREMERKEAASLFPCRCETGREDIEESFLRRYEMGIGCSHGDVKWKEKTLFPWRSCR